MNSITIVGTQSVIGANLAAVLSNTHPVDAIPGTHPSGILNECEAAVRDWCDARRPHHIVFCGSQAASAWDAPNLEQLRQDATAANVWAECARAAGIRFTLISSDACLTGPWMFHCEDTESVRENPTAHALRRMEADILAAHPQALVVRTHAFGWSPSGDGWLEGFVQDLQAGSDRAFDCLSHASPILASALAHLLPSAWAAGAHGILHIAGAERTNPYQFARRLAEALELPEPSAPATQSLGQSGAESGTGETSLRTDRFRRLTGTATPMLADGLGELAEQRANGYRDSLCQTEELAKAA